jgi:hypothetical protein
MTVSRTRRGTGGSSVRQAESAVSNVHTVGVAPEQGHDEAGSPCCRQTPGDYTKVRPVSGSGHAPPRLPTHGKRTRTPNLLIRSQTNDVHPDPRGRGADPVSCYPCASRLRTTPKTSMAGFVLALADP